MAKPKPKADEIPYDESLAFINGVGSYQRSTIENRRNVKEIKIVGFVRPKQKQRSKAK